MMRLHLRLSLSVCLFLLFSGQLKAQEYLFNFDNIPYSEIEGNFLTLNQAFDDTLFTSVPIGFLFRFGGHSWTKVHVSSNGELIFSDNPYVYDTLRTVIPFGADLIGDYINHTPAISYESGGCAGAVVMKIQFKECSFKGGAADDFINFQVWLYESNGMVEFHYGPGHVGSAASCFNGETGPRIGIQEGIPASGVNIFSYFMSGFPFAPDLSTSPDPVYLDGIPESSQVYSLEPLNVTRMNEPSESISAWFLNHDPVTGNQELHINVLHSGWSSIRILDLAGREQGILFSGNLQQGMNVIPVNSAKLAPGIYLAELLTGSDRMMIRFFAE